MNNKMTFKRCVKLAIVGAACCMPALGLADGVEALTETATEIEKFETGVKAVGGAIVGVTMAGSGYMLAKRWIRRI